jgi:hypothetical protein
MSIGEYVDNANPDGSVFGRSDSKIGFYGLATPIVKPTTTFAATSGTTVAASVAADLYALRLTLESLGLLTTA